MNNPEYRVVESIERPDSQLVMGFKDIPVANIDDCMNRSAALHSSIKPINKTKMLGTALTVSVPPGDNLLFYIAISLAKPGDIIAITDGGYRERALCGEIMVSIAKSKGIAGFLVDGAIRDREKISEMEDFSVFAVDISPNGPVKNGTGVVNVPIILGGKKINPGDIIVGDSDGVVVINPKDAPEILKQSHDVVEKEAKILEDLKNGMDFDFSWMFEKIKTNGCEIN